MTNKKIMQREDMRFSTARSPGPMAWRARRMMFAVVELLLGGLLAFGSEPRAGVVSGSSPSAAPAGRERTATTVATGFTTNKTAATLPAWSMQGLDEKQKLAVGDRVSFRVLEDQEEPKLLTVTDAGQLNVPELGLVNAVGKSCKELALELKDKLEQTTYYKATVIIGIDLFNKTSSGRKVYVAGQVRQAGPQEIPAGETWTVSRAILKAGGFTDFADKKHVRLVRGGANGKSGQTFYVNISEVWEKGQTARDLPVEPEDLIYVSARGINFY
jgi:protein involved in polysaccharide export with SLBB domain